MSILQGTKVYHVPIYQRRYSWRAAEWSSLWDDLEFKVAESATSRVGRPHFFGNIVVQLLDDPASTVIKYLVIDGQQRLTTLLVFLAAVRDARLSVRPDWKAAEYDDKYLLNPYDPQEMDRLVPTEFDRDDYVSTVREGKPSGGIGRAYLYFARKLRGYSDKELDCFASTVLRKFVVILVETDEMDPVNTIFNTLNSKGRPLLPPDLIRNEIFMHLNPEQADRVYRESWLPLEKSLVKSSPTGNIQTADFTTFFWSREVPNSPALSKKMLFSAFESRMRVALEGKTEAGKADVVLKEVDSIVDDLELFMALRRPAEIPRGAGIDSSVQEALGELEKWGSDTHIPIALWVLKGLESGAIDAGSAEQILRLTFSFMVTRALTGIPTNTLSRILSSVPAALKVSLDKQPVLTVASELSKPGNRWPSMRDAARSVSEYGLDSLPSKQQSMFRKRIGEPAQLGVEGIVQGLESWLLERDVVGESNLPDARALLAENLFNALETFTPYEYTDVNALSIALRGSEDSVRLGLAELEAPLRELVRDATTSDERGLEGAEVMSLQDAESNADTAKFVGVDELSMRLAADPDQLVAERLGQ